MPIYRSHVLVCGGTGCTSSGSREVIDAFRKELQKRKLSGEVLVVIGASGNIGLCLRRSLSVGSSRTGSR